MSENDVDGPQQYQTVIVVGGGCYGGYYVRQLDRAVRAGALALDQIVVVDRDPACAVAQSLDAAAERPAAPVAIDARDWRVFFKEYLLNVAEHPAAHVRDAIVPSPLMPHLMAEWLVERARARWSDRPVAVEAFDRLPNVPWERAGGDGTHYVSFATWTCPINCIEPRTCPVTRGPRHWSLPTALAEHAAAERELGREIATAVLHCRHRSYGVGMFDTAEVIAADDAILAACGPRGGEAIIGTVSHCHGALTRLVVGPPAAESGSPGR